MNNTDSKKRRIELEFKYKQKFFEFVFYFFDNFKQDKNFDQYLFGFFSTKKIELQATYTSTFEFDSRCSKSTGLSQLPLVKDSR